MIGQLMQFDCLRSPTTPVLVAKWIDRLGQTGEIVTHGSPTLVGQRHKDATAIERIAKLIDQPIPLQGGEFH